MPGLGPTDRRVPVNPDQPPWRAIGRVQTELGGRCTGFLIAPRVALTAAHCLYQSRVRRFIQPGSVHFVVGYGFGAFAGHARVLSYGIASGYDPQQEGRTVAVDWAVLRLDVPLGGPPDASRVLKLLRSPVPVGQSVALAGYERDRAEEMEADQDCRVTQRIEQGPRVLLRHDCDGTSGTSGAPLVLRSPDGTWAVAGLQVAAAVGREGGLAIAAWSIDPGETVPGPAP